MQRRILRLSVFVIATVVPGPSFAFDKDAALPLTTVPQIRECQPGSSRATTSPIAAEAPTPPSLLVLDFAMPLQTSGPADRLQSETAEQPAGTTWASAASGLPLRLGTLGDDVFTITTDSRDAGALQVVGVGEAVNMKLGLRLTAPAISTGAATSVLPWARATYHYDLPPDAAKLPTLLSGGLGVGGGVNLFSGDSVAASLSADWKHRDGAPTAAVSGLGRLRIGF